MKTKTRILFWPMLLISIGLFGQGEFPWQVSGRASQASPSFKSQPLDANDFVSLHLTQSRVPIRQSGASSSKNAAATVLNTPQWSIDFVPNFQGTGWDSSYQTTYAYSPAGLPTEWIYEEFNGTSFAPWSRITTSYNSQGLQDYSELYRWDGSQWILQKRLTVDYDVHGNRTQEIEEIVNGANWDTTFGQRTAFSYVMGDLITSEIWEEFDTTTHVWNLTNQRLFDFNSDSLEVMNTNFYRSNNAWVPYRQILNTYLNGVPQTTIDRSGSGGVWNNRATYAWQSWHNATLGLPILFEKEDSSQGGISQFRYHNTYAAYDSRTQYEERYNGIDWDSVSTSTIQFDYQNSMVYYDNYYYDVLGGWQLLNANRWHYTYDSQDRTTEQWSERTFGSSVWELDQRTIYGDFFTGIVDPGLIVTNVKAFPNPCADRVHFNLEGNHPSSIQITFHDLTGRLRMSRFLPANPSGELTVQLPESLENGVYTYRIQTKNGESTGKIAIQR